MRAEAEVGVVADGRLVSLLLLRFPRSKFMWGRADSDIFLLSTDGLSDISEASDFLSFGRLKDFMIFNLFIAF